MKIRLLNQRSPTSHYYIPITLCSMTYIVLLVNYEKLQHVYYTQCIVYIVNCSELYVVNCRLETTLSPVVIQDKVAHS